MIKTTLLQLQRSFVCVWEDTGVPIVNQHNYHVTVSHHKANIDHKYPILILNMVLVTLYNRPVN